MKIRLLKFFSFCLLLYFLVACGNNAKQNLIQKWQIQNSHCNAIWQNLNEFVEYQNLKNSKKKVLKQQQ